MDADGIEIRERIEALISALNEFNGNQSEVLVSCTEAGRLLGRSKATITAMIRDGRLKKTTIGDSTGILLSDIWDQAAEMR